MSVSDIAVTALTAVATVKGNQLTITTLDPRSGALPNIALDHVDIYASQTDTFASASVVAQGTLRALHADAGEEQTWYYWGIPYDKLGAAGTRYPSGASGGVACTSLGQAGLAFGLSNGKLVASVSASALTIAIKTTAGNDPDTTAGGAVAVAFPGSTLTVGSYQVRQIQAALSITIPASSTLGVPGAVPCRIWIVLFDDGGTLRMGVKNCADGSGAIYPLAEFATASSTIITVGGGASSTDTFYTPVAVTAKSFRIIGYAEWTTSTSFWTTPDILRLVAAGVKPGSTVIDYGSNRLSTASTTTVIPFDDTIPQISEGASMANLSFTPSSPVNVYEFVIVANLSHTVASEVIVALFKEPGTDALAAAWNYVTAADKLAEVTLVVRVLAGSVSNRIYDIRYGGSQVGTCRIDGSAGARKLGGVLTSFVSVVELMG